MAEAGLRARIRKLTASGKLPHERPLLRRAKGGFRRMSNQFPSEPCLVDGKREPVPQVAYLSSGFRAAFRSRPAPRHRAGQPARSAAEGAHLILTMINVSPR